MRLLNILLMASFISWFTISCSTGRKSGWDLATGEARLTVEQQTQYMKDAKKLWNTRHVQADLESSLSKFKAVADSNSSNLEAMIFLSRGHHLLADAYLQDPDDKKQAWETSVSWAEKGMATNPAFKKAVVDERMDVKDSVKLLDKAQIDCLYWAAVSLGKWTESSGIVTMLKYKLQLNAMLNRVDVLQPDFFYGGIARYWGVFYAVAPGTAGRSMKKSFEYFQSSLKAAPLLLETHLLYAEHYAARKGDRELFKKELNFVLNAKPDVVPELMSENILAQAKAKKMLDQIEKYF